jgi:hypothetical protein|tara:strand:+ start:2855 stop:3097 length:243 start_codon:yes stop_codon:yes gene_type:complete
MELCRIQTPNKDDRDAGITKTERPVKLQVIHTLNIMPKIRRDELDNYRPYKEKIIRKKKESYEEFNRDPSKRNKRVKKKQ